ncbi:MAG TPA: hypothetical protein VJ602_04835 [Paludibacter sp.]|nr:hypothetical protein [Paludibacter sp.]
MMRKHEVKQICPCARCASSPENEFAFAHHAQPPFEITLPLRIMRKLAGKKFRTCTSCARAPFFSWIGGIPISTRQEKHPNATRATSGLEAALVIFHA